MFVSVSSLLLCLFCLANVSSQNIPTINCATMMPDRVSTIGPQMGPSPFKIKVYGKTYKAGTPLKGKSYESLLLWLCFIYSVKCRIFGVCTILKNCMHLHDFKIYRVFKKYLTWYKVFANRKLQNWHNLDQTSKSMWLVTCFHLCLSAMVLR